MARYIHRICKGCRVYFSWSSDTEAPSLCTRCRKADRLAAEYRQKQKSKAKGA
jgi:hypothetical protein